MMPFEALINIKCQLAVFRRFEYDNPAEKCCSPYLNYQVYTAKRGSWVLKSIKLVASRYLGLVIKSVWMLHPQQHEGVLPLTEFQ